MTSLVALATNDAVIMGCDSLATTTRPFVHPLALAKFFDHSTGNVKVDKQGNPALDSFSKVVDEAVEVPYDHMTDVDKLINLKPLPVGVMFTGIAAIGDRTIKSLLAQFKEKDAALSTSRKPTNYTVLSIAKRLLALLRRHYWREFRNRPEDLRPNLEFLVGGYNKSGRGPNIIRIDVRANTARRDLDSTGISFGGQMREIQRIVFGVDETGTARLERRYIYLLAEYIKRVERLNKDGLKMPDLSAFLTRYRMFGRVDPSDQKSDWFSLPALEARWSDFSDQAAIDCVEYFIDIMRDGQRFSSRMPTVGGSTHIALITRESGFRWISKEEYRHGDHAVPKEAPARES